MDGTAKVNNRSVVIANTSITDFFIANNCVKRFNKIFKKYGQHMKVKLHGIKHITIDAYGISDQYLFDCLGHTDIDAKTMLIDPVYSKQITSLSFHNHPISSISKLRKMFLMVKNEFPNDVLDMRIGRARKLDGSILPFYVSAKFVVFSDSDHENIRCFLSENWGRL